MPQARAAAPKARAARSEVNGRRKSIDFRGVSLSLPAKCPGEVLFDVGDNDISGTLRTLLGNDQYGKVREKVAGDGLDLTETVTVLSDFLDEIFSKTYGITAGE